MTSELITRHAGPAPALIVSDLDGTFLSPDGTVSEVNAQAVAAAQRAGIPVIFATGRPVRWLEVISELPGAHPTVIASNGAVLYDRGERRVLRSRTIDRTLGRDAVRLLRRELPEVRFGFESGDWFGHESGYLLTDDTSDDPALRIGGAEELALAGDHVKILARHPEWASDDLAAAATKLIGDVLTVTHSSMPGSRLIELSRLGVSKASMLAEVCADLDIALADVAAFGDMPNDLDLLSVVGLPHAMENAHPLLLDLGIAVVPSNAESGVGRTISGWLAEPAG
ncbi:HAD-IIB family hydrolase [Microlunatus speluncae]|uniref:HAD-IIB family hydrolase n=1 Tax=Microlunatus speluncae TaxID=2594267 RepID=UPI0013763082|nr:HAD family hydrolase [Microlunatus speluncae]